MAQRLSNKRLNIFSEFDFDEVTRGIDGNLKSEFKPKSTTGLSDGIHPNRAGYLAMTQAFDCGRFLQAILN